MDKPQYLTIFILRPWLLGVGISECVFIAGMLLPLLFFKVRCAGAGAVQCVWMAVAIIFALKTLIWAVVEIELFARVIVPYCSGFVWVYGLILTIIHSLILLALCCCGGGGGNFN